MILSKAVQAIKDGLYALFIYRDPEPFSYTRDTHEMTDFTATDRDSTKN